MYGIANLLIYKIKKEEYIMVTLKFKCKTVIIHEKAATIIFNPTICEDNNSFFKGNPGGEISLVDIKLSEAKDFVPGTEYMMYLETVVEI